jgi:hypothetical protein
MNKAPDRLGTIKEGDGEEDDIDDGTSVATSMYN